MTKSLSLLAFLFLTFSQCFGHFMWIETNQTGELNKEQEINIFFGEFAYGKKEKATGDSFNKVKDFALTVVHPSGEKTNLTATPQEDCYRASFTPTEKGTYTVIMDNDKIEVYDLTKHNIGIFKAYYHATAKIQVGEKIESTIIDNDNSITIKNVSEKAGEVKLKVFYKNEILPNHDFNVFVPDQWTKKLRTDEEGYVTFSLPWTGTTYVVEATFKEETSGKYNDIDYNFVWHCASLSVKI